ncbi:MAG: pyrroline-5-carboxylate reductase [Syntrophomonadaceae bacterium]|nr:pyrroline-5-carboxylate reductase [Syntrophomonadaceae bacterium]MDD3888982.1 pyrroline-5-carboxylate reductase [Syntrophomonadaceae bacterium]MDD4549719.1 pyrroline-5-carboxylate reductase [Syntrophomonadaceae bacterium]
MTQSLGIIGCGKMGYALVKGITSDPTNSFTSIFCNDINRERTDLFAREFNGVAVNLTELLQNSSIIILAIKPQQIGQVFSETHGLWKLEQLLISIVAGITTAAIEKEVQAKVPVVRVMPNTPCLVAEGVSAIAAGRYAGEIHQVAVKKMLDNLGIAILLDEKYMDAITAVSGSGPGYVFLVVEAMMNAAVSIGLDHVLARDLVLNTIKGSIKMLEETGEHPAILRDQVCSPGGTTIAGIRELEENGIRGAFFAAIEKAFLKSIELGKTR